MPRAVALARLGRLEEKYRLLAELRGRREIAERSGATSFALDESKARSLAFREIAREFPGSLREMEHSSREALEARRAGVRLEIEAVSRGPARARLSRTWVAVVLEYHAVLREALAVKLWLARSVPPGAGLDEDVMRAFGRWHRRSPARHTPTGDLDRKALERYRRPPRGRLHAIVWERLEERFRAGREELERLVFHPPVQF